MKRPRNGSEWWKALPDHIEGVAVIGVGIGTAALAIWVILGVF